MLTEAVTEVPILVSSQDRTLAFYAGTPGLELVRADDSMLGIRWIQAHPQGGASVLTLPTWLDSMPPGCLLPRLQDESASVGVVEDRLGWVPGPGAGRAVEFHACGHAPVAVGLRVA